MSKLPTACPGCASALEVSHLVCPGCNMQLDGRFELPALLRLPREDLEFIVEFVRCSGSLKDMGKRLGQSYPTVRNRLDEVIERLSEREDDSEKKRRSILDGLAKGELSVKTATKMLKELE